jgi:hypothetical protein
VTLRGGYVLAELESFGAMLVEVLAQLVAGEGGDAAAVRARVLEIVTVEEAGRAAAARLEERMAPLVLSAVQVGHSRGDRGAGVVREAAERWLVVAGPEFVFSLVAAVEEVVDARLGDAG